MQSLSIASLLFVAAAGVAGHGNVITPPPRVAGEGFKEACGEQPFNNVKGDANGNIQQLEQLVKSKGSDASKCQLDLCKGIPFSDNNKPDRIQKFTPGQKVDFKVAITAPHTGTCVVGVIDTSSNTMIGQPLIAFDNYASTKTGIAKNNTDFSVTMPNSLPAKCGTAGECVLRWFWDSAEAKQTYIACIDFTFPGGGDGSAPQPAPPAGDNGSGSNNGNNGSGSNNGNQGSQGDNDNNNSQGNNNNQKNNGSSSSNGNQGSQGNNSQGNNGSGSNNSPGSGSRTDGCSRRRR